MVQNDTKLFYDPNPDFETDSTMPKHVREVAWLSWNSPMSLSGALQVFQRAAGRDGGKAVLIREHQYIMFVSEDGSLAFPIIKYKDIPLQ